MMVVTTVSQLSEAILVCRRPLGLVPTMGALHEGHLSLVRKARAENDSLAATIFVNPTQFAATEDLGEYPRSRDQDLDLLRREGVDLVFIPPEEEVYAPGFTTWVDLPGMGDRLEGAHRPGHFRGVATVVTKLLSMFRPDRAYFGQKDGQQAAIIRRLNLDLNLGAEIIVCPTVREPDGLALSSRNSYLDPAQRRAAPVVYRALSAAHSVWKAGVDDAKRLRAEVRRVMKEEPLVEEVYYVSVADADTLEELDLARRNAMVSTAVRIGRTRLIDNVILE